MINGGTPRAVLKYKIKSSSFYSLTSAPILIFLIQMLALFRNEPQKKEPLPSQKWPFNQLNKCNLNVLSLYRAAKKAHSKFTPSKRSVDGQENTGNEGPMKGNEFWRVLGNELH